MGLGWRGGGLILLRSLRFLETVELQISLKNYDPQKDKRFSGTVRLAPFCPHPALRALPPGPPVELEAGGHGRARAVQTPCPGQPWLDGPPPWVLK